MPPPPASSSSERLLSGSLDLEALDLEEDALILRSAFFIALHMLARSAATLSTEEKRQVGREPWFEKMMMKLGSQLSGASETDAQGLTAILWAMAQLEQSESPLVMGLLKRVMLLAQHGRVSEKTQKQIEPGEAQPAPLQR